MAITTMIRKRRTAWQNVVFGMIMIAIYLGMAYLLLFTSLFSNLYDIVRYIMGGVFAVYGVFRGIDCLLE